ncbi:MAG: ROK family protein [Candidatus Omnitrophica bacterium]|nr:ROK family protein [Candidatus Omnitrophota bacterium]
MLRFGLDLGGTKIEGAVLDQRGRVLFRERIPTEQKKGYRAILGNLARLYNSMKTAAQNRPHTLGIGTPGTLSSKTGKLKNSNTLCLNGRLSLAELKRVFRRPLTLENDANCFALAEALLGAGRGQARVFGVILGTGCGGGIVEGGRLLRGRQGLAGEWGHMAIDPYGPRCYCGSRGCVETLISGGGLEKKYRRLYGHSLQLTGIVEGFRRGEPRAKSIMKIFFKDFGRAMANLIHILDPDIVVLGGGVSNVRELYTQGLRQTRCRIFGGESGTPIVKNRLGDSAGVLGAALLGV